MESDRLDQGSLDRCVDVEAVRYLDGLITRIEHRMNLRQRDALHRDCDLNEEPDFSFLIGQAIEALYFPSSVGLCLPQLLDCPRPREVVELALLFDVPRD